MRGAEILAGTGPSPRRSTGSERGRPGFTGSMNGMRSYLTASGVHADIAPDRFTEGGWVLSLDGAEQSHVNLAHPEEIFYEYLRRVGNVVDVMAPAGSPITAVHLARAL